MTKSNFLIIGLLGIWSCTNRVSGDAKSAALEQQTASENYVPSVQLLQYESLLNRLQQQNDTLYLVNFWATWCKPCVKELPHFISTAADYKAQPLQLILVSLDTKDRLDEMVIPFISQNKYIAEHYLLDDNGRMNEWIPKIDASWDGAIPATVLYRNAQKLHFTSGQLSEEELKILIKTNITH